MTRDRRVVIDSQMQRAIVEDLRQRTVARVNAVDHRRDHGEAKTAWGRDTVPARTEINESGELVEARTHRPLTSASSNNRGRTVIVTIGGTDVSLGTIITTAVVETPRNAGEDAESILVTMGYGPINGVIPSNVGFSPQALLEWGVGGANFEATVDWGVGKVISVPASFLRVSLSVESRTGEAITPFQVAFSASLAYGSAVAGRTSSPTRFTQRFTPSDFQDVNSNPVADTARFSVPNFARSATVVMDLAGVDMDIIFDRGGSQMAIYNVNDRTNQANQHEGQFPIPNGSRHYILRNKTGAPVAGSVNVIFDIGL